MKKWVEREWQLDLPDWRFPLELERLRAVPAQAESLVRGLPRDLLTAKPDGEWSIQEQIGHLIDLEILGMGRIEDFIAGKEILRAADMSNQKTRESNHNAAKIESLIAQLDDERRHFISRLESLTSEVQNRTAIHPRIKLPMRPVDLMFFIAEHDLHHLARASEIVRNFHLP